MIKCDQFDIGKCPICNYSSSAEEGLDFVWNDGPLNRILGISDLIGVGEEEDTWLLPLVVLDGVRDFDRLRNDEKALDCEIHCPSGGK